MNENSPLIQQQLFTNDDSFEIYEIQDYENSDEDGIEKNLMLSKRTIQHKTINEHPIKSFFKKLFLFQWFGHRGTYIHVVALYLILLGVISALTGVGMDIAIEKMLELRDFLCSLVDIQILKVLIWVAFTLFFCSLAFVVTKILSPAANGSGVPEMKVTLLGNHIPGLLTMRTLIAKVIGLTLVIGGGMWAGKEGPFIHISGCIANQLTHIPIFHFLRDSNELLITMLSTSSSCGVSSNFGTAIGGLLFSVEVTATYFTVRNYWFGTLCSVIAACTFKGIFNVYAGNQSLYKSLMAIDYDFPSLKVGDSVIAAGIGIICGIGAILFISCLTTVYKTKIYLKKYRFGKSNYLYLIVICGLCGIITAPWGSNKSPLGLSSNETLRKLFTNDNTIYDLFGEHYLLVLVVLLLARFTITVLSISMPVPVGLFTTNIVVGALLGRLFGEVFNLIGIENTLGPSGMAIIGGACFVGAITQTFSAAVIMIELIDNIDLIIPMLIAIVITICVSRFFSVCVYDKIAIDKKLPYMPDIQYTSGQTAETIMDTELVMLQENTTMTEIKDIIEQLRMFKDKTIPVVNDLEHCMLLGQVKLSSLRKLVEAENTDVVKTRFKLDYAECPLHLLSHTPISQIHMLLIAARIDSAFVTTHGKLIGEVNTTCLADAINRQMKILI